MGRQNEAQREAERKQNAERETAMTGKVLGTQPGSEDERRQSALAMLRKKAQEKKEGKRVAVEESVTDRQAPSKKARAPKIVTNGALILEKGTHGAAPAHPSKPKEKTPTKAAASPSIQPSAENDSDEQEHNAKRDRSKKPTPSVLLAHLRKAIHWPPTRFADSVIMREMDIRQDVGTMLEHMNMGSFLTMAHPTYRDASCKFLATLEATFHSSRHAQQGWGKIQFKIDGKAYSMSFKEIGEVLGIPDQKNPFFPTLTKVEKEENIT